MNKKRIIKTIESLIDDAASIQIELQRLKRIVLEETDESSTPENPILTPFRKKKPWIEDK